jgi:hypothetical protein
VNDDPVIGPAGVQDNCLQTPLGPRKPLERRRELSLIFAPRQVDEAAITEQGRDLNGLDGADDRVHGERRQESFRLACQSGWSKHLQFHGTSVPETQYFVKAQYFVSHLVRHHRAEGPKGKISRLNASLPRWFQLFVGVAEVLAAVGLTLPGLTRILPWLVISAAAGIMIVTVSATVFHLARGEMSSAAITLVLFGIATFVAYMRYRVVPIAARRADNELRAFRRSTTG